MKVKKFNQCCQLERYNLIVTARYCTLLQFEQFHNEVHRTTHKLRTVPVQASTFMSLLY